MKLAVLLVLKQLTGSVSNQIAIFIHLAFYDFGENSSIYKLFTCSSCTKPDCYDSNSEELHISLTALHTFLLL